MHIWSFRMSFRKLAVLSVILTLIILTAVYWSILQPAESDVREENTTEAHIALLHSMGIEIDPMGVVRTEVTVPADFDEIYEKYSLLQAAQGYDLWNWAGMQVQHWSYPVTNTPNNRRDIRANLLTYEGTVIGYDLSDLQTGEYFRKIEEIQLNSHEF